MAISLLHRSVFHLARSPWMGALIRWGFAHMTFAIPVHRLRETATLAAFYHPQPVYPVHILLVPKKNISGLEALDAAVSTFLCDLFVTVRDLVAGFNLAATGYRLIANGGVYQEVGVFHFHLLSEKI